MNPGKAVACALVVILLTTSLSFLSWQTYRNLPPRQAEKNSKKNDSSNSTNTAQSNLELVIETEITTSEYDDEKFHQILNSPHQETSRSTSLDSYDETEAEQSSPEQSIQPEEEMITNSDKEPKRKLKWRIINGKLILLDKSPLGTGEDTSPFRDIDEVVSKSTSSSESLPGTVDFSTDARETFAGMTESSTASTHNDGLSTRPNPDVSYFMNIYENIFDKLRLHGSGSSENSIYKTNEMDKRAGKNTPCGAARQCDSEKENCIRHRCVLKSMDKRSDNSLPSNSAQVLGTSTTHEDQSPLPFSHGYLPYTNNFGPAVKHLPKISKTGNAYQNGTLFLAIIIGTTIFFLTSVTVGLVCFVRITRDTNDERDSEGARILESSGARPKAYKGNPSSYSSTEDSKGGSRPPSYRALAPPNYTQSQQDRLLFEGSEVKSSKHVPSELLPDSFSNIQGTSRGRTPHTDKGQFEAEEDRSCTPVIFGTEEQLARTLAASSRDSSFSDFDYTEEMPPPLPYTVKDEENQKILEGKRPYKDSHRIQDPIYEEVYEEEPDNHSSNDHYAASAPLYENLKKNEVPVPGKDAKASASQMRMAKGSDTEQDLTKHPSQVKDKLLENQAHIDNLMNQLTKKIVKQRSRNSLKTRNLEPSVNEENLDDNEKVEIDEKKVCEGIEL